MRFRSIPQLRIDGVSIKDIELDLSSRHGLIAILYALHPLQERYDHKIQACSFDKGVWTPTNLVALQKLVPLTVLPKKGGLNSADKQREHAAPFKKIRNWHSGVESCIHSLVSANRLNRCRDKARTGYDRYVAMAAIGRNLLTLGRILIEKEHQRQKQDNPLQALIAA
ncbi:MAG: hypothetical protein RBT11_14005 [Desulfobacterales bacterium]|nr:hypothetical protein [Desulfobacterales bacterium]